MTKMHLHRDDLIKVLETMRKFPDIETFVLEQDSSSGIGSITNLVIETNVNGVGGQFRIEISGSERW
jgi:hypothetical protein